MAGGEPVPPFRDGGVNKTSAKRWVWWTSSVTGLPVDQLLDVTPCVAPLLDANEVAGAEALDLLESVVVKAALQPLLDALFEGLGAQAQPVLSANRGRAGALLVQLITTEQRRYASAPKYEDVVEFKDFDPVRPTDRAVSTDRVSAFSKQVAYTGWKKAMLAYAWFDWSRERALANAVDDADLVQGWSRLHINDVPILWTNAGKNYNPDLLVVETTRTGSSRPR